MTQRSRTAGDLLRLWRQRRRHSQLSLALHADVSARHLSFIETGRARPSRAMLLGLAERLEIPLRDRNVLLLAAGYAPEFRETRLDDPALRAARDAVTMVLVALEQELRSYGDSDRPDEEPTTAWAHGDVVVPLRVRTPRGVLSFASTTTVFGTAVDVTLAELAIEAFLPADRETAELLGAAHLAAGAPAR